MRQSLLVLAILAACQASACRSVENSPEPAADGGSDVTLGGARPVSLFHMPAGYDPNKPAPLVLMLHGYGANGMLQDVIFRFQEIADEEGFFLVAPDGTLDSTQKRFWNATDNCCDFEHTNVDDVAYLTGLIDETQKRYAIDPKRVYVVGHSNGGAMAYRLACDAADRFAAVVSLAGPFYSSPSKCKPSGPVAIQHIHGTADTVVPYEGGMVAEVHPGVTATVPSAAEVVSDWSGYNKCALLLDADPNIDLDASIAGAETKVRHYPQCAPGGDVIFWSMVGTGHVPGNLVKDFPRLVYAFLKAHPKP
jgi:polyhydroxybutyrate depolymerase